MELTPQEVAHKLAERLERLHRFDILQAPECVRDKEQILVDEAWAMAEKVGVVEVRGLIEAEYTKSLLKRVIKVGWRRLV